jgi:hypothetical protein
LFCLSFYPRILFPSFTSLIGSCLMSL